MKMRFDTFVTVSYRIYFFLFKRDVYNGLNDGENLLL